MSLPFAIGVDAGGTKTRAFASRAEAAVDGEGANASSAGAEAAAATIADVVTRAAAPLGDSPRAIFVAAAGVGNEAARLVIERRLAERFPAARVAVEEDVRVALRAGIADGPGAVVVAGTGSIAYAEHGEHRARAGGAGYLLGDEGSGHAIGLAALKLLSRVYDGRVPGGELGERVAGALGVHDRSSLLARVYDGVPEPARIAALAPVVLALADAGDRPATKIVQEASRELGDVVLRVVTACDLRDASPQIAFAGGLLRDNSLLSFLLETRLVGEIAGASIVRVRDEPARTALRFAEAMPA